MKITYEEAFLELEKIVFDLQKEDVPLDKSIELFKKGIELQKYCSEILKDAETKVAQVVNENGELEEFIHERDE